MRKFVIVSLVGAIAAFGAACSSSNGGGGGATGGTGGAGGGTGGAGGGNGGTVDLCADSGGSGEVIIRQEEITEDTLLTADCTYILTDTTYIVGATLTIEPGVRVGGDNGSALIITTSGRIDAQGTAADPIVMTSSRAEGERLTGDWGGLVLLGLAKLSWGNEVCDGDAGECQANIEGLPAQENRGVFGGNDDTHDCGTLNYVRIEFAGFELPGEEGNELNGLTVGGCGSDTELDYIQVHRGLDDGVEFFGGTASIAHVIVTGTGDDGIDWDQGYRGTVQNFIVHHFAGSSNDPRGIEADNFRDNPGATPRSAPNVMYGTVVASAGTTNEGIVLRRGTWGVLDGLVVDGWNLAGIDFRDGAWDAADGGFPADLTVTGSCFNDNNPNYPVDTDCGGVAETDCNDESAENPGSFFPEAGDLAPLNAETDPMLGDLSGAVDDSSTPDYSVGNAACMGAFATMGADNGTDWTTGWTAFPVD